METVNPGRDQVIRVTVACGVLATVVVALRFLARWKSKASFAADDWWMVASLIPSYGMLAVGSISSFVEPASIFHADDPSDRKRKRWPAFRYIDQKPNGNVLEGRLTSLRTYLWTIADPSKKPDARRRCDNLHFHHCHGQDLHPTPLPPHLRHPQL